MEHFHWNAAVCLVELNVLAAREVVKSLVSQDGWDSNWIQLRTGQDKEDNWNPAVHYLTVLTYGILWRWLCSDQANS